jgi:hypothetical protein
MDKFGGESGSDKSSVLDVTAKDYRKLIFENAISEFDFRKYVFARQSELRFMLHRPWDVASTAVLFIQMLSRDLKRKKLASEEARNFSISWVFSACLCVVEACQEAAKAMKFGDFAEKSQQPKELNPQASDFFMLSAALGDLCNYARTKLKELGKIHDLYDDLAPLVPPPDPGALDAASLSASSSSSVPEETVNPGEREVPSADNGDAEREGEEDSAANDDTHMASPSRAPGITNASLNRALRSREDYDQLYLDVSMQAVRFYKTSMRKRLKQHVKEEIANLHLYLPCTFALALGLCLMHVCRIERGQITPRPRRCTSRCASGTPRKGGCCSTIPSTPSSPTASFTSGTTWITSPRRSFSSHSSREARTRIRRRISSASVP